MVSDDGRRQYLVKMLMLAMRDPETPENWDELVTLALQYSGSAIPRPTAEEFNQLKSLTVEQLMAVPSGRWKLEGAWRPDGEYPDEESAFASANRWLEDHPHDAVVIVGPDGSKKWVN